MLVVVTCQHVFKLLNVASQNSPTQKRVSKNRDAEPNASLCDAVPKEIRCRQRDFGLHRIYLSDIGRPPKCVSTNFGQLNGPNFALEELRKYFASGLDRNFGVHFSRPEGVNALFPRILFALSTEFLNPSA
jgi:hypothetical protein